MIFWRGDDRRPVVTRLACSFFYALLSFRCERHGFLQRTQPLFDAVSRGERTKFRRLIALKTHSHPLA